MIWGISSPQFLGGVSMFLGFPRRKFENQQIANPQCHSWGLVSCEEDKWAALLKRNKQSCPVASRLPIPFASFVSLAWSHSLHVKTSIFSTVSSSSTIILRNNLYEANFRETFESGFHSCSFFFLEMRRMWIHRRKEWPSQSKLQEKQILVGGITDLRAKRMKK